MPIITPNTSEQLDLTPMEPGPKTARINAVEATKSKKGTPMLVLDLTVTDGDQERPRKDWVVTEGPGSSKFDQLLRAIGMPDLADAYKNNTGEGFDTDTLLGQEVTVITDKSLDNKGQLRDGISAYLAI